MDSTATLTARNQHYEHVDLVGPCGREQRGSRVFNVVPLRLRVARTVAVGEHRTLDVSASQANRNRVGLCVQRNHLEARALILWYPSQPVNNATRLHCEKRYLRSQNSRRLWSFVARSTAPLPSHTCGSTPRKNGCADMAIAVTVAALELSLGFVCLRCSLFDCRHGAAALRPQTSSSACRG